jgi:alanyl-tRNA synthetase
MSQSAAKEFGAVALFGETYDEEVRVIQIGGPWSRELCGGTHVSRSSQIGLLSLGTETSVGSGSRRLEAFVGIEAFRALTVERALVSRLAELAKVPSGNLEEKLAATFDELKTLQRKLAQIEESALLSRIPQWLSTANSVGAHQVVVAELGVQGSAEPLRNVAGQLRSELGSSAVVIVTAVIGDKPSILVATGEAARSAGAKAGELVRLASSILGGGGGGKDDMAQGGGVDASKLPDAVEAIKKAIS